jgi:threonine aldolase
LRALCAAAHELGLAVHMDGARFANAVAHLGCAPADISARAGIDVLSFGATKNGALGAEAVVFFDTQRVRDLELRRKRAGHLWSKMRYVSAQLLAYVESGVAERNAARANTLAQQLGRAAGSRLTQPVESNAVFLRLSDSDAAQLRSQGFGFYEWGAADSQEYRFVVSWNQPNADVDALCAALKSLA